MKNKLIGKVLGFDIYFDSEFYTTSALPGSMFGSMQDLKGAMRMQALHNLIAECNEKD